MITPIFKLDSRERWRPQPVETVERLGTISGQPVNLSDLPAPGGRMDFPRQMRDPTDTPVAGYHRAVAEAELWWHQYWLWYLYNPWSPIAGTRIGEHEGELGVRADRHRGRAGRPPGPADGVPASCRREARVLALRARRGRPVIYVALDSHANFFTPGDRGVDVADGTGDELADVEWRDFESWASWAGIWGNSTGAGRSPDSPGNQGDRWHLPHMFHSSAR